ncbi:MAG: hypothetical protein ABI702_18010 [Burkholderiales bacterium]
MHQVILIHPEAPPKPAEGDACNGCGVCCLSEPCPAGRVVSLKRTGTCVALRWDAPLARYRCGLITGGTGRVSMWWRRLMRRYIAAGLGCDSTLAVVATGETPSTFTR